MQEFSTGIMLSDEEMHEIIEEYEGALEFPSLKPTPPFVVCPVGLVGAGKTMVIKPLSKNLHLLRISTDEIRLLLKTHGHGFERTREIALLLVQKYLTQGYSLGIDADGAGSTQETLKKLKNHFPHLAVYWIHIAPPESYHLAQLRQYQPKGLFRDAAHAEQEYWRRKPLHEHLTMPFIYTFDPSQSNLEEQIKEAGIKITLANQSRPLPHSTT